MKNSSSNFLLLTYALLANFVSAASLTRLQVRIIMQHGIGLVHLDVDIDVANELQRRGKWDSSEHEEKHVARKKSVAKELDGLQRTGHVRSLEVVEQSIEKYKHSRWSVKQK